MSSSSPPMAGDDPTKNGTDHQTPPPPLNPDLRSPSPKRPSASNNLLGLGVASNTTQSVISTHPHLAYYVFNLLSTYIASPPRAAPVHPLSVSSSGESDGSDEDEAGDTNGKEVPPEHQTPKKGRFSGTAGPPPIDKEALVRQIVDLLDNEEEEQVKDVLKPYMGELAKVGSTLQRAIIICRASLTNRTKF